MRAVVAVLFLGSLMTPGTLSLTRDDFYTNGRGLDNQLQPGDDLSEEIHLKVPITFYEINYTSIFINTNGLLSFSADIPSFINIEFPLDYPIIAPFYSNVDTRATGTIYYRETQDAYSLLKAEEDIRNSFPEHASFHPTSIFVVTWSNVGYYKKNSDKTNTYQVAIISDGTESYVEFLYPDDGIQWIQANPQIVGLSDARAQVGFSSHDGRHFLLKDSSKEHIRSIASSSNCAEEGKYIYRVGNIMDHPEEPDLYPNNNLESEIYSTCAKVGHRHCHTQAKCVDKQNGFCCQCTNGFYGNGIACLRNDMPLRIKGKISGQINGELLKPIDLQAYVVMSDGRTYTALANVPDRYGYDMQTLSVIGGVIGWMFAKPIGDTKNGYQLTGGYLNHTAEIIFSESNHKITIKQTYLGLDIFDQLKMEGDIVGSLPKIPPGSRLEVSEYSEQYTIPRPGLILSQSSRLYKIRGLLAEFPFTVTQTISYETCQYPGSFETNVNTLNLKVAKNFLGYESRDGILRFGMSNKIIPLGQEDPCIKGKEVCINNSSCVIDGDTFKCVCNPGYQYISFKDREAICIDINECTTGTHSCDINAQCMNQEGSFYCRCNEGYEGNGVDCKKVDMCNNIRCSSHSKCYVTQGVPKCVCDEGYMLVDSQCHPGCLLANDCNEFATCTDKNYDRQFMCECNQGYEGDGYYCEEMDTNEDHHQDVSRTPEPNHDEHHGYTQSYDNVENAMNATCVLEECWCPTSYDKKYELRDKMCYLTDDEGPTTPYYDEGDDELISYPLPECFDIHACSCPWTYHYDTGSKKCIPNPGMSHDTKGPSGSAYNCNVLNNCHAYAQCVLDYDSGKYKCQCTAGYEGDGMECTENEISCEYDNICDPNAVCTFDPAVSKHVCICNSGYQGSGYVCSSIGCTTSDDCEKNAECRYPDDPNIPIRICECVKGYTKDENDACIPDDYTCGGAICAEHATCLWDNSLTGYYCQCDDGYQGDGLMNCVVLNTGCDVMNDCDQNADCILDTAENKYKCECNRGYTGNGYECDADMTCERDPYICSSHATCMESSNGYVCQCNGGYMGNGTVCKKVTKHEGNFLILNQGMATIRIPLEPSKHHLVRPIQISYQMAVGLDVDCKEGRVYWSDITIKMIKSANYDGTNIENTFIQDIISPEGISVDWVSRNIFWTDSRRDTIEVANLDTKIRKVLFTDDLVDPRGIAAHPFKGKIFWSDWNRKNPKIEWSNMDGTDRKIFLSNESVVLPNSLAIDWDTDELCYADAGRKSIECVQIDTMEKRTIETNCSYPFGLAITPTHYYWTDWTSQKVESLNKITNERQPPINAPFGGGSNKLFGMAAVLDECRPLSNICEFNNGDCPSTHLCLLNGRGGRTCVCGNPAMGPATCAD